MNPVLSSIRTLFLGAFVIFCCVIAALVLWRVGSVDGRWSDTFEVTVAFPEVNDVSVGTPVRVRGVQVGQVVAIEYPRAPAEPVLIQLRLRIDAAYRDRLYADASASLFATSLLGAKIVMVEPGTFDAGPLTNGELKAVVQQDVMQAAAKLSAAAREAELLLHEIRTGNGTLGKLVQDDSLYLELKALAKDGRAEVKNVSQFVDEGRATLKSVRQGSDALGRLPIIRSYLDDTTTLLVRPKSRRRAFTYNADDIFEPGTAIIAERGKVHLEAMAGELVALTDDQSDVVVLGCCQPHWKQVTSSTAVELTRSQAETVIEYFKTQGIHKLGWFSRRKFTALGLGMNAPPDADAEQWAMNTLQVLVFTPIQP